MGRWLYRTFSDPLTIKVREDSLVTFGVFLHELSHINMVNIPKKLAERTRAIIIDSDKILLINRIKGNDSYWVVPGGAVESSETHEQAIKRECLEELGVKIELEKLFLQRLGDKPEIEGQQEFFYLCNIVDGQIGTGQGPEFQAGTKYKGEYIIKWVALKDLPDVNLKPEEVKNKIFQLYCHQLTRFFPNNS